MSSWPKKYCFNGFCLQLLVYCLSKCAVVHTCVHVFLCVIAQPADRIFVHLMFMNFMLVVIPSRRPLLAFPHDTNNSSTLCDKSSGTQWAGIHSCTSVKKKITTESTESQNWEQPLVASFCAWVHGGPQRCVAPCNSAAKGRQELHFSLALSEACWCLYRALIFWRVNKYPLLTQ